MPKTRFAPSPTGFLHRGHLLSALCVFAAAEAFKCKIHLRIEDHDQGRARPEYIKSIREDLARFGFKFESESVQSERTKVYEKFFESLRERGLVYRCACSRRELAAENPSNEFGEVIYKGKCFFKKPAENLPASSRLRTPTSTIDWEDLRLGKFSEVPARQCGDFVLKDRLGFWAYQFAVTVDDFEEGMDLVVRGEDLLHSTARQILLSRLLGRQEPPRFLHHQLLYAKGGKKLSKREHSQSLRAELEGGTSVETLLGSVCFEAGALERCEALSLERAIECVKAWLFKNAK